MLPQSRSAILPVERATIDELLKLADAIDRLLKHPELGERLARAARSKIEADFSVEDGAKQLLELFRRDGGSAVLVPETAPERSVVTVAPSEVP